MPLNDLFIEYGKDMPVRLPLHKNPGLEIVYIRRGHLLWECEGNPETIFSESIYFTLPWQQHGSSKVFESGYEIFFIVIKLKAESPEDPLKIEFRPEFGFSKEDELAISQLLCNSPQHAWPASPLTKVLMPEILEELICPGPFHSVHIQTLVKQVVLELAKTVKQGTAQPAYPMDSAWRLRNLLEKLDQDYSSKWTLDAMAAETGLKRTQASEMFKYVMGEPPLKYLTTLRISKAARLLESTTSSITDIAYQCGFSSSQHFTTVFKKKIGQTPLKFRKRGLPEIQVPRWT
jgi:AraC-like DNA-binding protein